MSVHRALLSTFLVMVPLANAAGQTPLRSERAASPHGSRLSFGLSAGTLGAGADIRIGLTPGVALRVGANAFQITRSEGLVGITYDMTPHLRSIPILLDLHPFASAFHLSGGVVINRSRLLLRSAPAASLQIGAHSYTSEQVSSLDGRIEGKRTAPWASLGFRSAPMARGHVGVTFELGAVAHGAPQAVLAPTTSLTGAEYEQLTADVALERGEIQRKVDDLPKVIRYYPVMSLGLNIRP